jgi:hypothetical protein
MRRRSPARGEAIEPIGGLDFVCAAYRLSGLVCDVVVSVVAEDFEDVYGCGGIVA